MIGDTFWATGINVKFLGGSVAVSLDFLDSGFCQDGSTEGRLTTRYYESDLARALDVLIADAQKMGIRLGGINLSPTLYVPGDGERPDVSLPSNWREILNEQCDRLGWRRSYEEDQ